MNRAGRPAKRATTVMWWLFSRVMGINTNRRVARGLFNVGRWGGKVGPSVRGEERNTAAQVWVSRCARLLAVRRASLKNAAPDAQATRTAKRTRNVLVLASRGPARCTSED